MNVREIGGTRAWLTSRLDEEERRQLPPDIRLFVGPSVDAGGVARFLDRASTYLVNEVAIRRARAWRLERSGLLSGDELDRVLTCQYHPQSWALYYGESGGLDVSRQDSRGLIPCSTMQNHGVGWRCDAGEVRSWLVTARKPGSDWDMDSDIGHESAHAGFAPVPVFVQTSAAGGDATLLDVESVTDLGPAQIARLLYCYSEIAVVALRGESRPTYTCLPVGDPEELRVLVRISSELFRDAGFDGALRVVTRCRGRLDPAENDAVLELAAPVIRLLPALNLFTNALNPPDLDTLRSIRAADLAPTA